MLGQQITVTAAIRLAAKLVAAYGEPLCPTYGDSLTHTFPTPERIAQADLRSVGMPAARAEALSSVASVAAADPSLFRLTQTLEDAIAKFRSLRGIGEWTAQYIAMRVLGEPDAFPAADIGLMRALTPPGGSRPSASDVLARAEAWRPWRAYAAQHLWTADGEAPKANTRANSKDDVDAKPNAAPSLIYRPDQEPDRDNASHP